MSRADHTTRIEKRTRSQRVDALVTSIRQYDPTMKREEVQTALDWSSQRFKSDRITTVNDLFSDPLLIAEELVKLVKADRRTVLAAILYPAVRPRDGLGVDAVGLHEIGEMFKEGDKPSDKSPVRKLVERTLRLRSLNHLKLKQGATQSSDEQLRLFNLMSIWIAEDPAAIAIRVTQRLLNIKHEAKDLPREQRDDVVWQARMIGAPTAYLAEYATLRSSLLKEAYVLEDPEGYAVTKRKLASVGSATLTSNEWDRIEDASKRDRGSPSYDALKASLIDSGKLTEKRWREVQQAIDMKGSDPVNYALVKDRYTSIGNVRIGPDDLTKVAKDISDYVSSSTGIPPAMFDIEVRQKDPASTLAKTTHKKKTIEEMGDQFGFRIVLKVDDRKDNPKFNVDKLDEATRERLMEEATGNIQKIYAQLSKKFGRGSRDTDTRAAFKRLAVLDPHPVTPGRDDRMDDYIKRPKASGYSAMQDAFFFKIKGVMVEFEGQIVDEVRHDNNMYGPRAGRVYYKTDLADHADTVLDYYRHAGAVMAGHNPKPKHVLVFDQMNQIHMLPGGATVNDFADHINRYNATAQGVIGPMKKAQVVQADVENDDPFVGNRPKVGPGHPLKTGDRIFLELKNA